MANILRFCAAQVNPTVGDLKTNCQIIIEAVHEAQKQSAQVVIFPELVLTGYTPEDILLRPAFLRNVEQAREYLCRQLRDSPLWILLGYPSIHDHGLRNTLGVLHRGNWLHEYHKQCLPNDTVFDERRYFVAGTTPVVFDVAGTAVGLSICEDIWHPKPIADLAKQGAQVVLNISASPFTHAKYSERLKHARMRVLESGLPLIYTNLVGGQDELVFDGGSFCMNRLGDVVMQAPYFVTGVFALEAHISQSGIDMSSSHQVSDIQDIELTYNALVLGLKDYVRKNGFDHVLLGLSGGIDSALSLAIAVDALGASAVMAVMMPSRYTSELSIRLAKTQTDTMGVRYLNIGIDSMCKEFEHALAPIFADMPKDTTEENLQARCRGVLLMALSNKLGGLLLSTGNKSEMAVGYATLYGDMAGGFNPIKDASKTLVYELARYRNSKEQLIPSEVLERPPTAELRSEQKDSDTLPPYEILDDVIQRYVENRESAQMIIDSGLDADTVHAVIKRLNTNEYKRQQSAIGTRISSCSFSRRDRRYPVSFRWTEI